MTTRQKVCVLGSTGSIGTNTLDVMARHPERYEVFALAGGQRVDALLAQCLTWRPRLVVMSDAAAAGRLRDEVRSAGLSTEVLSGEQALCDIASHPEVDVVMGAIVGQQVWRHAWPPPVPANDCCWPTRRPWWSAVPCSCRLCAMAVPLCCPSTANTRPFSSACRKTPPPGGSALITSC